MKVYVDELPKSCLECKCAFKTQRQRINENGSYMEDCMMCIPLGESVIERHNICPLQSLADYTKQVRKEVVQEIKSAIKEKLTYPDNRVDCPFDNGYQYEDTICSVLEQVQGVDNANTN